MVSPVRFAPRVVLDTNVLVSALLVPVGSSARLLKLAERGSITLLYDDRILWEYDQVLRRPRFGFSLPSVEVLIEFLLREGERVIAEIMKPAGADPTDQPFFEVAFSGGAELLVTGNRKHFPQNPPQGLRITGPAEALKRLTERL